MEGEGESGEGRGWVRWRERVSQVKGEGESGGGRG